jgi:hypothetical protein
MDDLDTSDGIIQELNETAEFLIELNECRESLFAFERDNLEEKLVDRAEREKNEAVRSMQLQHSRAVRAMEHDIQDLREHNSKLTDICNALKKEVAELAQELARVTELRREQEAKLTTLLSQKKDLKRELEDLKRDVEQQERQWSIKESAMLLQIQTKDADRESLRREISAQMDELISERRKRIELEESLQRSQQELERKSRAQEELANKWRDSLMESWLRKKRSGQLKAYFGAMRVVMYERHRESMKKELGRLGAEVSFMVRALERAFCGDDRVRREGGGGWLTEEVEGSPIKGGAGLGIVLKSALLVCAPHLLDLTDLQTSHGEIHADPARVVMQMDRNMRRESVEECKVTKREITESLKEVPTRMDWN